VAVVIRRDDYTARAAYTDRVNPRADVTRWDELALERVTEMVARKAVPGDEISLTQVYLKKGALVPVHTHASEQMIYVLQGGLRYTVDATDVTLREGEVLRVPPDAPHQAEALDDTFVLVVVAQ
jgi:quercetin dioxygenase-like cupin family protein